MVGYGGGEAARGLGAPEDGMPLLAAALLEEAAFGGDVMRFPWEDGEHGREAEAKKEPSRAEIMERFRRAKAERGM